MEKIDRRVRKTKAQLRTGLAKLMQEKSIKEITVKELTDQVDIHRSTFYLHYTDIYQLLETIENDLLQQILEALESYTQDTSNKNKFSFIIKIFGILYDNQEICRALLGENGDIAFVHRIECIIAQNSLKALKAEFPSADCDLNYVYAFCMTGCVGLIKDWLLQGEKDSPEHMAELTWWMVTQVMKNFQNKRPDTK